MLEIQVLLDRLQLANKDIPAGYSNWIKKKTKAQQMVKSLGQELGVKMEFQEEVCCLLSFLPEFNLTEGFSDLKRISEYLWSVLANSLKVVLAAVCSLLHVFLSRMMRKIILIICHWS